VGKTHVPFCVWNAGLTTATINYYTRIFWMAIRAIIFDVGGVLLRTEDHSYRRHWDERLGLNPGETEEIVFNSDMGQKAQRGEISDEDLWLWIGTRLELGDQIDAFRTDFWAGDVLDVEIVAMIRKLKRNYQTAVISNATDALRTSLENQHEIADAFDIIIGSAEENVMKPSPAIFQRALEALGRKADETIFIDDFVRNVEAAKALGMHAIHYRAGMDLAGELEQRGVTTDDSKEMRA
jgi:putative hydrolase of the HAD superfamily